MTEYALQLPRPAPGKAASVVLAVVVHLLLAAVLIYGIHWQTHTPTTVSVELVSALPEPVAAPPPPEPAPVPVPKVEPKPEPKPEPPPKKPDIAIKEKPKPPPKPVPPKTVPPKEMAPKPDPLAEQAKRETEQLQQKRIIDAELDKLKADRASAALSRAQAEWSEKIASRIKSKIVRPPGASGSPVAIYEISLLPDGSLLGEPKLKKTTGNPALDAAIERAIRASSPLPKPDNPSAFQRILVLTFRPLED